LREFVGTFRLMEFFKRGTSCGVCGDGGNGEEDGDGPDWFGTLLWLDLSLLGGVGFGFDSVAVAPTEIVSQREDACLLLADDAFLFFTMLGGFVGVWISSPPPVVTNEFSGNFVALGQSERNVFSCVVLVVPPSRTEPSSESSSRFWFWLLFCCGRSTSK